MLVGLTLRFFPHVILPNKLLTELGALAKAAGLDLPLVEELAADIYQGQLSDKFLRAAKIAARVLSGTVYERYYDARFAEVLALEPSSPLARGRPNPSSLAALCERRAAVPETARYSVARNGCIVEQGQVLTTHNLAVLFDALPLRAAIGVPLTDLARRSFQWILAEHGSPRTHGHAKLLMLKNTAYAWRQMVFYLALAGDAEARAFGPWASAQLAAEPPALAARLRPVVDGLLHVLDGGHLGAPGAPPRLLGWTTGPHVLG